MSGKGDKRLHARTQAPDMADRWAATFGPKREVQQAERETCAHSRSNIDLYKSDTPYPRWSWCARCGQAFGWPE